MSSVYSLYINPLDHQPSGSANIISMKEYINKQKNTKKIPKKKIEYYKKIYLILLEFRKILMSKNIVIDKFIMNNIMLYHMAYYEKYSF
jgi:hypothetical protein